MDPSDANADMDPWLQAVSKYDLEGVLSQYASDAVLLPTVISRICKTPEERRSYFKTFLSTLQQEETTPVILWHTRISSDVHAGLYRFGHILARFTFVMQDGLIVHHHSSSVV